MQGLVFLEIPYSQASGFFGNLAIYHELGHFVWDKFSAERPRRQAYETVIGGLEDAFNAKLSARVQSARCRNLIKSSYEAWTQELFCDLFAIRYVGPAASFALIDVLSLFGLMQDENDVAFDKEHPAPALRLREQLEQLKTDGWWGCIEDLRSEHVDLIHRLSSVAESAYKFVYGEYQFSWKVVEPFLDVIPQIQALAVDVTPGVQSRAEDFRTWRSSLEECLVNGVVPSKLLNGDAISPTPDSMINAAYCVYLARLPELMDVCRNSWISSKARSLRNPIIDKKWIGRLEIANVSNTPVLLYPGRPIAQLILLHVAAEHDPSAKLKSTYFGPIYPEPPSFQNPEQDLLAIGIGQTSVIRKGKIRNGGKFEADE